MAFLRLLPFLLCLNAIAQVNLYITDNTNTGFKLGINDYLQNPEPVKELLIKKLDTNSYRLRVQLSSRIYFYKNIKLRESGTHHYIITTNSRDELQLRYRGMNDVPPPGTITLDLQKILPLKPDSTLIAAASKKTTIEPAPQKQAEPITAVAETLKEQPQAIPAKAVIKETPLAERDTLRRDSTTTARIDTPETESPPALVSFEDFKKNLEQTDFEFEKLTKTVEYAERHVFTIPELKMVLQTIKYDNTRLQLLKELQPKIEDLKDIGSLRETLEYEISKQQFNNIFSSK